MKQQFGHKGKTLLQNLIAGLHEAKRKWVVRYEAATNEKMKLEALKQVNWYNEEIAAYKNMLREGLAYDNQGL